eukprot:TRINITY_DN1667_c0_g1_i3.p1 TRINITY_DN1667_c0_g1~~TRINITY_DN1667_c0_g1_i3.p1  ORF type:complete len:101 (-),score=28.42 TRINITY_DN1667_c0_g1_i3:20-322(-)
MTEQQNTKNYTPKKKRRLSDEAKPPLAENLQELIENGLTRAKKLQLQGTRKNEKAVERKAEELIQDFQQLRSGDSPLWKSSVLSLQKEREIKIQKARIKL